MSNAILKVKLSRKKRVLFIILAIILLFAILEFSLRISGYIFLRVAYPIKVSQINHNEFNILCLGDSFTQGFGASFGYSYPEQLESLLHKKNSDIKIRVFKEFNINSSTVLKNLPNNIMKYKPDLIIIMTGCNDRWSLENCTYFKLAKENLLTKTDILLSNLSVYKLAKISLRNLGTLLGVSTPWFNQELIDAKLEIKPYTYTFKNPTAAEYFGQGECYFYSGDYNFAIDKFKLAEQYEPKNPSIHVRLACIYLQVFYNWELGTKHALQALAYGDSSMLGSVFTLLYVENAKDGNYNIIREMENVIKDKYLGEERAKALKFLKLLCLFGKEKEEIEKLISYNLDRIMAITKRYNTKVILMDYPNLVFQTRSILRKKADFFKIPFIDNYALFSEKLKQASYKREDLFAKDSHCNAAGYAFIAENIYKVLTENKIIL